MRLTTIAFAVSILPAVARGQAPDPGKILLENEYVRVVQYASKAGSSDQIHPRASYVLTMPDSIVAFEIKKIDMNAVPLAEDPFANNPKTLTVKFENDSVRVMQAVIPPAWKETQHTHPPYVTYVLSGGTVRMHFADGTTRDVSFNTGEAKFTPRVTHWAENIGADTVKVLVVELRHK